MLHSIFQSLKGRQILHNHEELEILLIEDNDIDAELTLRAMEKHRLSNKIRRLTDGQEAIDYLFSKNEVSAEEENRLPQLILLDLKLPMISGLEVLRLIKSDPRTKKIPVVVLTSSTEDQDISACYQLGVNSYIVKPVEFENFMDSVQKLGFYWLLLNRYPYE